MTVFASCCPRGGVNKRKHSTHVNFYVDYYTIELVKTGGDSANAVPSNRNYTTELLAFGVIAGVSLVAVQ